MLGDSSSATRSSYFSTVAAPPAAHNASPSSPPIIIPSSERRELGRDVPYVIAIAHIEDAMAAPRVLIRGGKRFACPSGKDRPPAASLQLSDVVGATAITLAGCVTVVAALCEAVTGP